MTQYTRRTRGAIAALGAAALLLPAAAVSATAAPTTTAVAPSASASRAEAAASEPDFRTIVTADAHDFDTDDTASFYRLLTYSNEFGDSLEGLIYSSSFLRYTEPAAGGGRAPVEWDYELFPRIIDEYAEVHDNLRLHDPRYPSPERLHSLVMNGNLKASGEMAEDSEGAMRIKEVLLDADPRPVHLQMWGGTNTVAAALRSIADEYSGASDWPAIRERVAAKAHLYVILDQDATFKNYIEEEWPDVNVVMNRDQFRALAYPRFRTGLLPDELEAYLSADFMAGIKSGPFLDGMPLDAGSSSCYCEGDSPAFFGLIDNGLRSHEDPTWGGWGGRFLQTAPHRWSDEPNYMASPAWWLGGPGYGTALPIAADANPYGPQYDKYYAQTRWLPALQNDYLARAAWQTESYADANHNPRASVAEGLDHMVRAGQSLTLNGSATDPDGDDVNLTWWDYAEAGSYPGAAVDLTQGGGEVTLRVPADAVPGETIHLILEATDDGTPALTHYQRVVLTVAEPFTDINRENQFYDEISWLSAQGISTGWDNGNGTRSYRPLDSINRDAMAAFLYRKAGSPAYTAPRVSPFSDVATDNQFYKEISWLHARGISTGWDNGDGTWAFRPLQPIARDAMAAFLYREAGSPAFSAPAISPFDDVNAGNQFYREITWMHAREIARGWDANDGRVYYQPLSPVARDAMAAFLYRATAPAS